MSSGEFSGAEVQSAYNDLKRLIPALALELDHLRAALREHNLWLQRYGHTASVDARDDFYAPPGTTRTPGAGTNDPELPAYSASDVPPYTSGPDAAPASTRDEVQQRRDQLIEWLAEGEDTLREYSNRFAQLAQEANMPAEDLLGTWSEASPDNALPDYERIEPNEERMVGGVGEVPPPYVRGPAMSKRQE